MKNFAIFILSVFILCNAAPALAETSEKPFLKEFGILSGTGSGKLKTKDHYKFVPVIARFGFELIDLGPKNLFEFELEPYVGFVTDPETNKEYGANLLLKYGYFLTKRICPYVEGGAGVVYQKELTVNVGSHVSFLPQAGAGLTYFLNDNLAVNAGYRYRHLSDAGRKEPNRGINSDMWLTGISWFF